MSKFFLHVVLPFLLPLAVFAVWVILSHRTHGNGASVVERITAGPWLWILVAGFVLFLGGLGYLALEGAEPGGTYIPPYEKDGQIVPGQFVR